MHPGDFFRNSTFTELPNPDKNLEAFLIWFLDNYQSDRRIAYIDDLSKIIDDELFDITVKGWYEENVGEKSKKEILTEIELVENELKAEAFKNFYQLLSSGSIEIVGR
jgi:hypothetical protein